MRNPVQVRIEGYLDASEQQVNPWAMLDVWLVRAPGRRFALTNLIVLSAGPVSGPDILAAVQPLHPNFIFNGDQELLDRIGAAAQRVPADHRLHRVRAAAHPGDQRRAQRTDHRPDPDPVDAREDPRVLIDEGARAARRAAGGALPGSI